MPDPDLQRQWDAVFAIEEATGAPSIDRVVESLRDDAIRGLASEPGITKRVLDGYADALERYARTWSDYLGAMGADALSEPLAIDRTPLGLIETAVRELMEAAVRQEASLAIGDLAYFPVRAARLGLENRSIAFLRLLNLSVVFSLLGLSYGN